MFRTPLCPSSGAHDDSVGYHIGRLVLELLLVGKLSAGRMDECSNRRLLQSCYSLRSGPDTYPSCLHLTFQLAATREPDGLCGIKRYRRELVMMGIMVPETC